MKIINNTTEKLADDLRVTIKKRSRVSMAAACFSVYAFEELKAQLENLDELRFIFTSPAFLDEKPKKAQREFYIPRLNRERTLHGSEFEIKLRSEFRQRAISQECAHWIREKARFKSNKTMEGMTGFLTVDSDSPVAYAPVNGFTREDLGCDRGGRMFSMINRVDAPESKAYLELFDQLWNDQSHLKDVTDKVLESITTAYQENSPEFLYFYALYNIFGSFLEQVNEDDLPSEANGFKESQVWNKLYTFQKDAVIAIISKLEQYNGCILADSVGLGKTFTALAVIKYYENRNLRVLVLCPKKLSDNWMTYKANYVNNPIAGDRLRYDVLYHTDLSRDKGFSGEIDLSKLNWSAYDLVVIDESHNFRNGGDVDNEGKENRYTRLMNKVIRPGARTRVLMLSATPVNNRFYDLRNQLALAYEGDSSEWQGKLDISRSVEEVFRNAQKVFNEWSKLDVASRATDQLMQMLDFEFFQILDAVTIARSRRHIEKYYDVSEIGKFPTRLPPISKRPPLTDLPGAISYSEIYDDLLSLTLSIYTPTNYILPSKLEKYAKLNHEGKNHLTQAGREQGIRRLMSINLLKRLESSLHSFQLTLGRIEQLIAQTLDTIAHYDPTATLELNDLSGVADLDADDQESDLFTVGRKVKIELADMDYVTWRKDLEEDGKFAEALQTGLAESLADRPQKVDTQLFVGRTLVDANGEQVHVTQDLANAIYEDLIQNDYVKRGKLTDKYFADKEIGSFHVASEVSGYADSVVRILSGVYDAHTMAPENAHSNNVQAIVDEEKLHKAEFLNLWNRINHKSFYTVQFDTPELIDHSIRALDSKLNVTRVQINLEYGEQTARLESREQLEQGKGFQKARSDRESAKYAPLGSVRYDLVGKLVEETGLTRATVAAILRGIAPQTFSQFRINPEEFILKAARLINDEKATQIIEHITYNRLDAAYDQDVFTRATLRGKLDVNAIEANRSLYSHVIYDSDNERRFAQELDVSDQVAVYVKLPGSFYISTPVGKYNPDWAIAFNEGSVKHIYFVAETKGNLDTMELRGVENAKIECAKKHFAAISNGSVVYSVVDNYSTLMQLVSN